MQKQTAESPLDHEAPYFQMMLTKKVDGVLIAGGQIDVCKMSDSYLDALRSLSDSIPTVIIGKASNYYMKDGYQAACALLAQQNDATAALAMNDNVALGALRAFQEHDLAVPGDIALVSCDQFYNGDFLTPRLTSVDRHNERLGQYVISLLLSKIQHSTEPEMPDLAPELRIRESSKRMIR